MIFDCDEIHELRVEAAKRHATMSKDEVRREIREEAERALREIEALRRQKQEAVGT